MSALMKKLRVPLYIIAGCTGIIAAIKLENTPTKINDRREARIKQQEENDASDATLERFDVGIGIYLFIL
jgi:Mg2+ and Co2+ transporter CorA